MTFSHSQLPMIRFGRQIDRQSGADFYAVLNKSDTFPADAEAFFRETICKSVQWESGRAEQRYDNAFLLWKFHTEQILVAQISDAGNDLLGRPHSMQIIAVLIDAQTLIEIAADIHSTAELNALLFIGLPNASPSRRSNAETDAALNESLQKFLKNSQSQNLLIADSSSIINRNIEIFFDFGKQSAKDLLPEKKYYYQKKHAQNQIKMSRIFSTQKPQTLAFSVVLPMILIILIIALSVIFVRQYVQLRQLRRDFQQLTKSHEEIVNVNSAIEQETQELRRQSTQQNEKLAELRTQHDSWRKEKILLEEQYRKQDNLRQADKLEFEQQLLEARQNAQQSLLDENERLRRESIQNDNILNEIEQLMKKRLKNK
ncbi:MAG: hypothetical protein LBJ67_05860 [Planctomycetaceae bacterium]|jgi:hypothetical protein|nr:hypothetical protein [Planctomycetaceae bacterium]